MRTILPAAAASVRAERRREEEASGGGGGSLKPGGGFIGAAPEPRWARLDRWIRRAGGSVGFSPSVLLIRVSAVTSGPNGPDRYTARLC